ncbi:aminotransferase class I/II-fold pyridoxal phosphate-dependent enzyme [Candidatus Desantisbacteria bacterium]|nr:aminotransferase class I/II-fold pyridoxal phosphate-dependent enzyme [Candidatus Desantisbacteria bacterium]
MKELISHKVNSIPPSGIRRFFDLIASMEGVVSLGVGEPDFVTPWHIREAAVYAIEQGYTAYTSNAGLPQLRQAISQKLYDDYSLTYSPEDEVLITVGVSEALDLALRAIINPGDEIIIPEPCYVSYKSCTILANGVPVIISTKDTGFKVTPDQIEAAISPKTKAILLSYPSNPTGTSLNKDELMAIAEVIKRHNLLVISDEIYSRLSYDQPHTTIASLPGMRDNTILLDGFSKAYAMTGWRVGYAAGHKDIIGAMCKIHQYSMLCASIVSQKAAVEALKNGRVQVEEMRNEYNRRRRLIVDGFNRIGDLECFMPEGAFYAFPSIISTGLSSDEFAERLLFEEKVAVVPGNVFGECGSGYIRCSYATSLENIEEALRRIKRFVDNLTTQVHGSK